MKRILIMGANSAIAEATARLLAARGDSLFLIGRSGSRLEAAAADLKVRGATAVEFAVMDARDLDRFAEVVGAALERLQGLDGALIAHGTLSDQDACSDSLALLHEEFVVNALSTMALCTLLANTFLAQRHGVLAVISSVAGDRGRRSNYVYGSAKAAVTAFTSGLRQRLFRHGVRVVTIKPGFVSTPMTAAFRKGLLWAQPSSVARTIVRAMDRGTPVCYTPWFWRPIMWVIRAIPESLLRRLPL